MSYQPISDLQWQMLEPLFPKLAKRTRGKPHTPWRHVLNSILFVLMTGAKWESLPKASEFASKSASHRWFVIWKKSGFIDQLLHTYKGLKESSFELVFPPTRNRMPKAQEEMVETISASI